MLRTLTWRCRTAWSLTRVGRAIPLPTICCWCSRSNSVATRTLSSTYRRVNVSKQCREPADIGHAGECLKYRAAPQAGASGVRVAPQATVRAMSCAKASGSIGQHLGTVLEPRKNVLEQPQRIGEGQHQQGLLQVGRPHRL